MCTDQYSAEYSEGILCRSLEFSFLSTILPCKLCLCLPGLTCLPPQFREPARLCLASSFLCSILETRDNQGQAQESLWLFTSQGSLSFVAWYPVVLKPLLHVFVWILGISDWTINLVSITLILAEAAIQIRVFLISRISVYFCFTDN